MLNFFRKLFVVKEGESFYDKYWWLSSAISGLAVIISIIVLIITW